MKRTGFVIYFFIFIFSCGTNQEKTFYDELGLFSVTVDKSWKVYKKTGKNGYTDLILAGKRGDEKGINIMVSSRLLFDQELQVEPTELIVHLLNSAQEQYEKDGFVIINKGKTYPLINDSKTISLVAKRDNKLLTLWTGLKDSRIYNLIISTDIDKLPEDFELNNYYKKVKFIE